MAEETAGLKVISRHKRLERGGKRVPVVKFANPKEKSKILEENGINLESAKCEVCGKKITLENLGLLKVIKFGKATFICSSKDCLSKSKSLLNLHYIEH